MTNDLNIRNLALSETGFVFDPQTGNTYVVNEVGIDILNLMKKNRNEDEIIEFILDNYETNYDQVKRDYDAFLIKLKLYGLYKND